MSEDFSPNLRRELLDDFYAECDELLTAIREGLIALEKCAEKTELDAKIVEGLFRNTHSLKGISAIVGLRAAEELAHAMEDLLRALSKREIRLTSATVDQLLAASQRLEKVVIAHRLSKDAPDTGDLLEALRRELSAAGQTAAASTEVAAKSAPKTVGADVLKADPVAQACERGLHVYLASFSPAPALDKRGVNVTSVRQRLSVLGEIISATPSVRGKGLVVFEFVVGLRAALDDFSSWEADGVRISPVEEKVQALGAKSRPTAPPFEDAGGAGELSLTPSHIVRVDLARLDDLMRIVGELVIHRSRLEDRIQQHATTNSGLKEINLALSRSLREMREAVTRVRMVPIAELFTRMPFVVRDLMRDSDKKARVVLEGGQTEVDKYVVERLKEPLLHLVRNAFAHGIEPVVEREAAGKPAEATITLRAKSVGESVVIQIRDDGRGVDSAKVVARAKELELPVSERVDTMALLKILCAPGFSTRDQADMAAGRGVGMAVVANTLRELSGLLTLETWPGAGTQFTLKLPLTLSIADAIIVNVNTETCAVPQSAVDEIIQIPAAEVRSIQQTEVIPYRDGLLPVVRLRTLFKAGPTDAALLSILVVSTERGAAGLVVDRVRSQREIVIRPLADSLLRVPGISGATELGDGRPILILDPNSITQGVVRPPDTALSLSSTQLETRAS